MRALLALILAFAVAGRACGQEPPAAGANAILVEVNGVPLTRADLDEALVMDDQWRLMRAGGAGRGEAELRRAIETRVLEMLIDEVLLVEAAKNARVKLTPEEEREMERQFEEEVRSGPARSLEALEKMLKDEGVSFERVKARNRNRALVRKLVHEEVARAPLVKPSDIRQYYDEHRAEYRQPGTVEISQIVVRRAGRSEAEARALIDAARQALAAGKDFADVARGYPDTPNHERGGKTTVQAELVGDFGPEVAQAIAGLGEGETSGVIEKRKSHFLIIRLDRRTPEQFSSFEKQQDAIYEELERLARGERYRRLVERLRQRAFIKRR